jgi:hypothetical protein
MFQGRLHPAHHRSQMTMTTPIQIARRPHPIRLRLNLAHASRHRLKTILPCMLFAIGAAKLHAQSPPATGSQVFSFAGLRAGPNPNQPQGQINAVAVSSQGNLYLLINQQDGVRLLETDSSASAVLAQAQIGAAGDQGLAMALDPTGNLYVTGTTTSGALPATSGSAFTSASVGSPNSFIAKFDSNLHPLFLTFTGAGLISAGSIAATSDAVFIAGTVFSAALPVTPAAVIQSPSSGSVQNGFVEKFSSDGTRLLYATYLSGAGGSTTASSIAADSEDNAYVVGATTAPGYPTMSALIPQMSGTTSGFLTKLSPAGDSIVFSTFIPGAGITSLALDSAAGNLLLSGSVSPGQFPITNVSAPLTALNYQTLIRMPLDGSAVLTSTILAPGTQSFVTPSPSTTAWVAGDLSLPLLPLTPLSTIGNSFAIHVNSAGLIDQTARLGGIASSNPINASAPVVLTSTAVDSSGNANFAGSFQPSASQNLLATQTFDLPLANAPTAAFPSTVRAAVLPQSACNGSLCTGSAAYLARISISASAPSASLVLSAEAASLQIAVTGFTSDTNCATQLPVGGECSIALSGTGPGNIAISASNALPQTQSLPALPSASAPLAVVFSPRELDFGIVSSASGPIPRSVTVTNLTAQNQTFTSTLDAGPQPALAYTITETQTDCTPAGISTRLLAPGASCHITLSLTASNSSANDGAVRQNWLIGTRDLQLTAYAQAAALSLSASQIDFGTQYHNGLHSPRSLFLSNNSTVPIRHAAVTLPASSPFSIADSCPDLLQPFTVCQLKLTYQSARAPSSDSVTLTLDQNLAELVTGTTLPQPAATNSPSLVFSATSINFATPVAVTAVSTTTQTVTLQNTGPAPAPLTLTLTGDFSETTSCASPLAPNASCNMVFTFAPSQPGTRNGLLTLTSGTGVAYVNLTGTGAPALSPTNNGTLNFGDVITGQPSIQWYKVAQAYPSLSASIPSAAAYTATLVEDLGFGHGQPPATAFTSNFTGSCFNCWLGLRFLPSAAGLQSSTLSIASSSAGNPYLLSLTGTGIPATGLLLTPVTQDFGPIAVNSSSPPILFTLSNLSPTGNPIAISAPSLTGDFALSPLHTGGAPCGGTVAYTASCFINVSFAPIATGPRSGTLTLQAGGTAITAALTGFGSTDPGLALNPSALIFNPIPGPAATQQTITLTNTTAAVEQIGPVSTSTPDFNASTTCATLAPAAACSILVRFFPTTAPTAATLTIPVTTNPGGAPTLASFSAALTGSYTTQDTGLQILPGDTQYGPQSIGALSPARQFTINNLTAKSLSLSLDLPRQFVLTGAPCTALAPNASCTFSLGFLPLTNGDITGTVFAHAIPTDGYGIGSGVLAITGPLQPGSILNFGQLASGQTALRVLTLTNSSATAPLTIRRITSPWPFLSTSTCAATLVPSASCTVTLIYSPINQVSAAINPPPTTTDTVSLIIESDAASSPDLINLAGSSTPIVAASPSNAALQPILAASQNSLTFAATIGATSSPQTVILSNTGTASLSISAIQSTSDFALANTCSTLAPGATCTVTASFTPQNPTGPSTRSGAIEISSNASTPLEFVSLFGTIAPAMLTVSPASLDFGTILIGASSTLSLQLSNPGTTAATLLGLIVTGDYSVSTGTCPTPGNTLLPGAACTLQITFTPTQTGTRPATLSIANSASILPLTIPLTGIGYAAASFALTVDGAASASDTVKAGSSATYALAVTPLNAFTGTVTLACIPIAPAAYATCSIAPASVAVAASTQTAVATITTVTNLGQNSNPSAPTRLLSNAVALCLILPAIFFRIHARRALRSVLWTLIASIALVSDLACGGSKITPITDRNAPPGNYQYQVTATSTIAGAPVSQAVILNLTVQ